MGDRDQPRRPGLTEALITLAASLATAYVLSPPQERLWLRLTVLGKARTLTDRLARRTGRKAMADELAGRNYDRYGIAYKLSVVRDRIDRALADGRP